MDFSLCSIFAILKMIRTMSLSVKKIAFWIPLILFSLVMCSCGGKWYYSLSDAEAAAEKSGKNIFLFTGTESESTDSFKKDVLQSGKFKSAAGKKFVLLDMYLSSLELEKKSVEEVEKEGREKSAMLLDYNIRDEVTLLILSKEGYFISAIPFDEKCLSAEGLIEVLEKADEDSQKMMSLVSEIRKTDGTDKVRAIDALYEATDQNLRRPLLTLCREVPVLDSGNITGLLGKYELQITFDDVYKMLSKDSVDEASEKFVDLAENGHLDRTQKFHAYYYAAYLYPLVGSTNFDRMLELLELSYASDPSNEHSGDISLMIEQTEKMKKLYLDDGLAESSDALVEPVEAETEPASENGESQ